MDKGRRWKDTISVVFGNISESKCSKKCSSNKHGYFLRRLDTIVNSVFCLYLLVSICLSAGLSLCLFVNVNVNVY